MSRERALFGSARPRRSPSRCWCRGATPWPSTRASTSRSRPGMRAPGTRTSASRRLGNGRRPALAPASATTRPGTIRQRSTRRPVRDEWFVTVHTCSGSTVNPLSPTMVITSRTSPGIGIRREATGSAPARPRCRRRPCDRARRHGPDGHGGAQAATGWTRSATRSAPMSSATRSGSCAGPSTSATARCGPSRPILPRPDRLATTHAYGPGQFAGDGHGARHG